MTAARFSIGIDLGTTNSAMAFVPLAGSAPAEVFPVLQWQSVMELAEAPTLPSFLYLPEDAVAAQMQGRGEQRGSWVAGALARKRAGETPGRVAHSAKSWLCHHGADRYQLFLPWGSEDLAVAQKISPVRASALVLNYLRGAWDSRFAASGDDFRFDAQEITVTVPASFDAAAQRLTLEAAAEAGFPKSVRLLEEPQAAFYRWLEKNGLAEGIRRHVPEADAATRHVLVVDVGGGTSDFSLFAVSTRSGGAVPEISRLAVSDHILLGGDNIDLAVAHLAEPRLAGSTGNLSRGQWEHLVARCRDQKERALAAEGAAEGVADQPFTISIPSRGSGLIAGTLSAQVTRGEIEAILLDGFFPACDAEARPIRARTALRELGLPYATDSAVTRHLADFLRGRPPVDAVLFNGGSLYPPVLRDRVRREIGKWQRTDPPAVLENPQPDLAVACGAAWFGKLLHLKAERIQAGAARAVFVAAHGKAATAAGEGGKRPPSLICVVPRGAASEETFAITGHPLELRIGRPVRFQAFASTRHGKTRAGSVVDWEDDQFQPLPPLETVARLDDAAASVTGEVPVTLTARLNELGLLQVACVSNDPNIDQTWPLEFNLRAHEQREGPGHGNSAAPEPAANASPQAVSAASERISNRLSQPLQRKDKLSAGRLLKSLETILGLPKGHWNGVLLRSLWPSLEQGMNERRRSVEHEEAWFILAGYLLRPGFGVALDEMRMDALWRVRAAGLCFPGKRNKLQEYILWRRVAGGLGRERQERVLAGEMDVIRRKQALPAELVLMAGAFERLGPEAKAELIQRFIAIAAPLAREQKHCAPYLAALGMLLSRTPVYAGPETVVSPDLVETAYEAFERVDWAASELAELQGLFLRAARVVDNRSLDVQKALRNRIASKLERAGVAAARTAPLKQFTPLNRGEGTSLFGEALPPGLLLRESVGTV